MSRSRAFVGRKEFWGSDLRVTPATLVPRPETETVVEAALARRCRKTAHARSAHRRSRHRLGRAAAGAAVRTAERHRHRHRHQLRRAAIARATTRCVSASRRARILSLCDYRRGVARRRSISSFPTRPISPAARSPALTPEVRDHDPRLALDGGPDGPRRLSRDCGAMRAAPGAATAFWWSNWAPARPRRGRAIAAARAGIVTEPPKPDLSGHLTGAFGPSEPCGDSIPNGKNSTWIIRSRATSFLARNRPETVAPR